MNTPMDDLIRSALTDIAEEAVPMNLTDSAVNRARKRRALTVAVGVAGVVTALTVGTPLAFAAVNRDAPPPAESPSPVPASPVPISPDSTASLVPIDPGDAPSPVPIDPGSSASLVPISPVPSPPVDAKGSGKDS